ncbi:MAG: MFS transporter, partial [bacterium]
FAARSFISKSLSGLGIVFATILLEIVSFPPSADPANLDTDIVWRLGAGYVPAVVGFFVFAIIGINGYRLTREQHEANLVLLAEREAS